MRRAIICGIAGMSLAFAAAVLLSEPTAADGGHEIAVGLLGAYLVGELFAEP